MKQTKFKFKVRLGEVTSDSDVMVSEPVEPALTDTNMAGRFVFLPASSKLWPAAEGVGGWVGKVAKVDRRHNIVDVKFADGMTSFMTSVVLAWKPLS